MLVAGAAGFCSNSWFLPLLNCLQLPQDLPTSSSRPWVWVLFVGSSYDKSVFFF